MYPLDTVRTHIQACAACIHQPKTPSKALPSLKDAGLLRSSLPASANHPLPTGMWQTIRYLVNEPAAAMSIETTTAATSTILSPAGWSRLWRGVQTIMIGCIPAHALYFCSYEFVKATMGKDQQPISPLTSSLAGAAAACAHDSIMTPLDTMKQRIQLGYYNGSVQAAFTSIVSQEGWMALYRSFPITLLSNVPYGMVMVATHEHCKQWWTADNPAAPSWQAVFVASSISGCVASAVTTPLDRIKTALQTQHMVPSVFSNESPMASSSSSSSSSVLCRKAVMSPPSTEVYCPRWKSNVVTHETWYDAARSIYRNEGIMGFYRGLLPRVMSHTPAVAISWTTYETTKQLLLRRYDY